MKKILTLIALITIVTSTIFAQRAERQQGETVVATTNETEFIDDDFDLLSFFPARNDDAARTARAAFERMQYILTLPQAVPAADQANEEFETLESSALEERQMQWQRAFNVMESLYEFLRLPAEDGAAVPSDFTPDSLVLAYYLFGRGFIYNDMVFSGFFEDEEQIALVRNAAENLEDFVQVGIGPLFVAYNMLTEFYASFLNDLPHILRSINRTIANSPADPYLHLSRAEVLRQLGRYGEACAALRRASELGEEITDVLLDLFGC